MIYVIVLVLFAVLFILGHIKFTRDDFRHHMRGALVHSQYNIAWLKVHVSTVPLFVQGAKINKMAREILEKVR